MYIKLDIPTEFEVKSLTDLPNFKNLMENLKMYEIDVREQNMIHSMGFWCKYNGR